MVFPVTLLALLRNHFIVTFGDVRLEVERTELVHALFRLGRLRGLELRLRLLGNATESITEHSASVTRLKVKY